MRKESLRTLIVMAIVFVAMITLMSPIPDMIASANPTVVTIQEAKELSVGTENVMVEGIVTFIDGKNVAIEDNTGGINVYLNANAPDTLALGDKIRVMGKRAVYRELMQLSGVDATNTEVFTVISSGNPLPIKNVTLCQLKKDDNSDSFDFLNERVAIKSVVIGEINTNGSTTLTQGDYVISIYRIPELSGINQGDMVDVIAVVRTYNGYQFGVEFASDVTLSPTVTPINQAPTHEVCTVNGVVTFIDGRNVYIEDGTGAIDLYLNYNTVPADLKIGDYVRATGTYATFKGLRELINIDGTNVEQFEILGSNNDLPLQSVTIAEILADQANETFNYMCERVEITDAVIGAINNSGNTLLTQGDSFINIYKIPTVEGINETDSVNVVGIVSIYNNYQIRVASATDIKLASKVISIKEARAYAVDTEGLTVKGIVTNIDGRNVVIEDDTAGITLRLNTNTLPSSLKIGDMVQATGKLGEYKGLLQLANIDGLASSQFKIINSGNTLPLTTVTIETLLSDSQNTYQNMRIFIEKAIIGEIDTEGNTSLTQGEHTINIYRIPALDGIDKNMEVNVTAIVGMFNTIQLSVVNATDVVPSEAVVPTITIQEAKDSAVNTTGLTVKGVVTFIDGRNVYIEDNTGAIVLYLNSNTVPAELKVGDIVRSTGKRAVYNGLIELSNINGTNEDEFIILSSDNELPLQEVTLETLKNDTTNEYLSERVIVKGLKIGAINTSGNTPVSIGEHTINIYKVPALEEIVEGDTVNIIAVVGTYKGYQLRVKDASDIVKVQVFTDPITEDMIPTGVLTIKEALALADNTENVSVIGQLVYVYGNYDSMNSAILEDVINGEVYALQVYNALSEFNAGDVLVVSGKKSSYGNVPQLSNVTAEKITSKDLIEAIEFDCFDDLLSQKDAILSARVVIKNVTLGTYNSNGSTVVTDEDGNSMNIYRSATYPTGVNAGEVVNLFACYSKFNSSYQLRVGSQTDFKVGKDIKAPVLQYEAQLPAEVGVDFTVVVSASDNVGVTSVAIEYTINGIIKTSQMTFNAVTSKYEFAILGKEIVAGISKISFSFTAFDQAGNSGIANGEVSVIDLPQIVSVTPHANSSTYENKRPVISVTYANAMENPQIELYLNEELVANSATYTPSYDMADGQYSASVIITRTDGKQVTYSWVFTVGEPLYDIYFGQIHSHTAEYSDGSGTLEDAFEYAMNEAEDIDFLAVTDHSNYFDSSSNLGDMGDPTKGILTDDGSMTLWQEALNTTDYYNSLSDDFVALYGYEMTWSGQYGHMNTYNTPGFVSRNNPTYAAKGGAGLVAYYELLTQYPDSISMFNHPGTTFGTFESFGHYSPLYDKYISLIEVGNGEGAVRSSAYWDSYEYYQLALDKGWHLAPANNQDNHKGYWGDANTARTCIITDNFTREGVYQAFRDMAVYSTEDQNLSIYYYLNDYLMGSILEEKPDTINIKARISDPNNSDSIGKVSLIANGGVVVWSNYYNSNSAVIDIDLPCEYSYYYLKIDQADKDIAVTAPVWTGDVTKVGITSVEKDTLIDVKGEVTNFTINLYNYEETDLVIDRIEYLMYEKEFDRKVNVGTITPGEEMQIVYPYTVLNLGKQTITIKVVATFEETEYIFLYDIEFDAMQKSDLIDIAIDAGHNNFYISGNYADSDANLVELFGGQGIRSHHITEDITYDAIKNMRLLILTVPYGGWEAVAEEDLYTTEELNAIKEYADNGGNIIVCSKSDRGNPKQENLMAHNISNTILETIGAKARIANGIVVDNVIKANEAYRITFTEQYNYNYNTPITEGIFEITNNSFSCYNGAPVIANGATPIVMGSPTTWGANYTENFGGSSSYVPNYETDQVVVPMGNVNIMTYETLSGGGFLIASGVTFFSTFEVKVEIENASTRQNSNYQIVMNIADHIKPEPIITDIAEVRESELGYRYTIEGIVTSNASGFDQTKAFFDCIYIQDETGGINIFPVDGDFQIGQKVRVSGVTSSYNNERQLKVSTIELIDDTINPITPNAITLTQFLSGDFLGDLVKLNGRVHSLIYTSAGDLDTIMLQDFSGRMVRVFLDGYIMPNYTGLDNIKVGDVVTAIGLCSKTVDTHDPDGKVVYRLRVRDREEITYSTPQSSTTLLSCGTVASSSLGGNSTIMNLTILCILAISALAIVAFKKRKITE